MDAQSYKAAVINSALWAALGDAVGWISELTDEAGVRRRVGASVIEGPVAWERRVFSRGPTVGLPAGTYSDDTQLRLSVCRATRSTGEFDVEAFASLELPVWLSYSLGAGKGSTAAAANLAKPAVSWFSNYYESEAGGYFKSGGNGAAMRVQPHVWKSGGEFNRAVLGDVVKDSIVTHGHLHALCGAVFHAVILGVALKRQEVPDPGDWLHAVDYIGMVPEILQADRQLKKVWLPAWEDRARLPIFQAIRRTVEEIVVCIDSVMSRAASGKGAFEGALAAMNLRDKRVRGSGLLTAIAAAALAYDYRQRPIEGALLTAANAIGTDTDTIGTMCGAILGAARPFDTPRWKVQDREYLMVEAGRIADIAVGKAGPSFAYPDLMRWQAPDTQSDAVGVHEHGLAVAGLGAAEPWGPVWEQGDFCWQWMRLWFGQTVLAKRRLIPRKLAVSDLPASNGRREQSRRGQGPTEQQALPLDLEHGRRAPQIAVSAATIGSREEGRQGPPDRRSKSRSLDELTDEAIKSNFHPDVMGRCLAEAIGRDNGLEAAVAFASIVAKAQIARRK